MRICVLQSSLEGSGLNWLENVECSARPDVYTDQHTFETRFISKATAKSDLDAAVREGFDFYFNFLWGTPDDPVAGAQESLYFESMGVPSCGIRSEERFMTKNHFYRNAKIRGSPPVPGSENFPLFVKPANGCGSQMIDEQSICYNQEELNGALERLNKALHGPRVKRAEEQGREDPEEYAKACALQGRDCEDVVVQEFISGIDVSCTVVQMGQGCLALAPYFYKTKETAMKEHFLTADLKFDPETAIQVLQKRQDPALFERIQKVAIDGYAASGCRQSNMGCDVDVRVRPSDGAVFAIEVNPQPAAFMNEGPYQDLSIIHSLPGKHAAAVNIFITNHLLGSGQPQQTSSKVAQTYDVFSQGYDGGIKANSTIISNIEKLVNMHDFEGLIFDLGCGTGVFGRVLSASQKTDRSSSRLLGFDISPGMLQYCQETYDETHIESMEMALVNHLQYADTIDHIVCFTAICFLRPEIFSFAMVLCLALANRSITITVDEIPDAFNEALVKKGDDHMHMYNHIQAMEAFGEPAGWRLKRSESQFSWASPTTGVDIYSTCFRFERIAGTSRDLMSGWEKSSRGKLFATGQ